MSTEKKSSATQTKKKAQVVFQKDEMNLCQVHPEWTEEEMLDKEGIFFLKDVAAKLKMSSAEWKKKAADLEASGKSSWEVMGIRKTWTHWIVRMKKFGEYFRENAANRIQQVEDRWDGNQLLAQKGRFYLADVCDKIPFTSHQIRYQVRRSANAKKTYGVWKDPNSKSYVVEMETFSKWIQLIWKKPSIE